MGKSTTCAVGFYYSLKERTDEARGQRMEAFHTNPQHGGADQYLSSVINAARLLKYL